MKGLTVPPSLIGAVLSDTLSKLADFQLDELGVTVSGTVVLDQKLDSLVAPAVGHEESRRFRDEEHREHHANARKGLQDDGNPPRQVVIDVAAAEGRCRRGNAAAEPPAVVETSAPSTPLRRGDFYRVGRSSDDHDGDTDTENEPASDQLTLDHGRGCDDGANDNHGATAEHGLAAAVSVRQHGSEWSADHRTANE